MAVHFASGRARPSTLPTLIADWPACYSKPTQAFAELTDWLSFIPLNANAMLQDKGFARRQGVLWRVDYRRNRGSLQG